MPPEAEAEHILQVDGLDVAYGDAKAIFGLSFSVPRGSVTALLGANCAGKSTLARAVSGVLRPTAGTVTFDGRNTTRWSAHRLARAGLAHVPEGRGIFPRLSVHDNLRMGVRHAAPRGEHREAIERAYELFPRLGERRRQLAGTLSGGEQQMLALGRVLAVPPSLLVADEMSLGLAPLLVDMIFESLEKAKAQGVTVLLIEQYVDRALALADQALVLRRGELVWSGSAAEAREQAAAQYLGHDATASARA
ncbi:MAG: ABC transporter ATP-binding protein [Acidimicrobiales bacterium]